MVEQLIPIVRVSDANEAAEWYGRLGFVKDFEHRYSEEFPAYVGVVRNGMALHLSEHVGDATPDSLIYLFVEDVDALAEELGAEVSETPWAREIQVSDPDGNRVRIGTRRQDRQG